MSDNPENDALQEKRRILAQSIEFYFQRARYLSFNLYGNVYLGDIKRFFFLHGKRKRAYLEAVKLWQENVERLDRTPWFMITDEVHVLDSAEWMRHVDAISDYEGNRHNARVTGITTTGEDSTPYVVSKESFLAEAAKHGPVYQVPFKVIPRDIDDSEFIVFDKPEED